MKRKLATIFYYFAPPRVIKDVCPLFVVVSDPRGFFWNVEERLYLETKNREDERDMEGPCRGGISGAACVRGRQDAMFKG